MFFSRVFGTTSRAVEATATAALRTESFAGFQTPDDGTNLPILPITLKPATPKSPAIVDPIGMIYVLHEEEAEVRKNPAKQVPLVIRGNVYDCVDVIFKNEIPDDARTGWANKINLHPHFFQFDTSASDGPTIGFSYDMSLRAFTMLKDPEPEKGMPLPANTVLTADSKAGARSITVNVRGVGRDGELGDVRIFEMDETGREVRRITAARTLAA